jgi:hypothetical protein
MIVLASIISLAELSVALCLFMVFTWKCMTVFDLLANYHQDVNFVVDSNNGFHLNEGFNSRWNELNFLCDNCEQGGNGDNFNRNEPSVITIIWPDQKVGHEQDGLKR